MSTFSVYKFAGDLVRSTNDAKAYLFMILALLWSTVLNLSPVAIGVWYLFQGEWLAAILAPIILYLIIGLYMAFWPYIAILVFLSGWLKYGFLDGLLGAIIFCIVCFIIFWGPEWLMHRAYMASMKSAEISARLDGEHAGMVKPALFTPSRSENSSDAYNRNRDYVTSREVRKVLIVFYEESMLEILVNWVKETDSSIEVDTANSGREALAKIEIEKPSVLVSDIVMPDMTGIDLLRELEYRGIDLPVLLLSGSWNADSVGEAGILLGDRVAFAKLPVSLTELACTLDRLMGRSCA